MAASPNKPAETTDKTQHPSDNSNNHPQSDSAAHNQAYQPSDLKSWQALHHQSDSPNSSTSLPDLAIHSSTNENVTSDKASGKETAAKSYDTEAGVKVTPGNDGRPQSYNSNGFTFEHRQNGWVYHQDNGGKVVNITEPTVSSDGTVHAQEKGGWNDGRQHSLNGDGERTGDAANDKSQDPTQVVKDDQPKNLDEVLQSLAKLEKALPDNDGLKYFNSMYQMVTQGVKDGIAKGEFKDPAYIEKLDVNFANMYMDSIKDNLQGKPMPDAWQQLFNDRNDHNISPVQFAGAGMMAHIEHDLPFALDKTNKEFGINPGNNSVQHADFETFNNVLKGVMPPAMAMLNHDFLGHAANATGQTGQDMAMQVIETMRDGSWAASKGLAAGGHEADITGTILNHGSGEIAEQVLHPGSIPVGGGHHIGGLDGLVLDIPSLSFEPKAGILSLL